MGLTILEIAENINRRVIAGAIIPWTAMVPFRINQVTRYHYEASLGVLPMVVAMNKDKYASLSPNAKKVIDESGDMLARLNGQVFDTTRDQYMNLVKSNPRHTVTRPTVKENQELRSLFQPLHDGWKRRNGSELYNALVQALTELRKAQAKP